MIENRVSQYVDYINEHILSKIDYKRLHSDCMTEEKSYAKTVLNALHNAVISIYGSSVLDDSNTDEFVMLPAVIQSKGTGKMCIALVHLDMMSSGEHCGTVFLTKYGCVGQDDQAMSDEIHEFIHAEYGSYDYCYTVSIEDDIHVCFEQLPDTIKEVLGSFQKYTEELFSGTL